MSDYTPTAEQVRECLRAALESVRVSTRPDDAAVRAEFERWLNADRARIWDEGYRDGLRQEAEAKRRIVAGIAHNERLSRRLVDTEAEMKRLRRIVDENPAARVYAQERDDAEAERDRLRAAMDAVKALHVADEWGCVGCRVECMYCEGDHPHPCPTLAALDEHLGGSDA